jgi:hypothetical protein
MSSAGSDRIVSLDQFRGYTVLGMFLVNFVGSFAVIASTFPVLKHHHTYCSYADTIMPQFFFAVGFAYRLTLLRRWEKSGPWAAFSHAVWRILGLLLVAFVVHHLGRGWAKWAELGPPRYEEVLLAWFKRDFFQTLAHIAVTSLWVMPVIAARPSWRIAYATASGLLHLALSYEFNYRWVNTDPRGIDGGPLGFLTWSIPLLAGSLAYDVVVSGARPGRVIGWCLGWGAALMALAYVLSCLHQPPADLASRFHPTFEAAPLPFAHVTHRPPTNDLFTMSQRSGSLTYLVFGAGLSLAVYGLFVWACDARGWQVGVFRTLGTNALAGYVLHSLVDRAVSPFVPNDSPLWYVATAFAVYLAICYLFIRYMEKNRLYLRL